MIVTNIRHYENLLRAKVALEDVTSGVEKGITNDHGHKHPPAPTSPWGNYWEITTDGIPSGMYGTFCIVM